MQQWSATKYLRARNVPSIAVQSSSRENFKLDEKVTQEFVPEKRFNKDAEGEMIEQGKAKIASYIMFWPI